MPEKPFACFAISSIQWRISDPLTKRGSASLQQLEQGAVFTALIVRQNLKDCQRLSSPFRQQVPASMWLRVCPSKIMLLPCRIGS